MSRRAFFDFTLVALIVACATANLVLVRQNRDLHATFDLIVRARQFRTGAPLPELDGRDLHGRPTTVDFAGARPTLLLVHSEACGVCKQIWPYWNELIQRVSSAKCRIVFVETLHTTLDFLREHHLQSSTVLVRPFGQSLAYVRLVGTPQTIIVSKAGRIAYVHSSMLSETDVRRLLRIVNNE